MLNEIINFGVESFGYVLKYLSQNKRCLFICFTFSLLLMVLFHKLTNGHVCIRLLTSTIGFFYQTQKKNPKVLFALTTFQSLKPWWVWKLTTWNTCCCHYHQELKELFGGFNNIRTHQKGLHETCNCNCNDVCIMPSNVELNVLPTRCNAHPKTYVGLIDLQTFIVCPQPTDAK